MYAADPNREPGYTLTPANWLDVFLDEHFDNARMERVYPNAKKTG